MALGARFVRGGLGLFLFGVFLTFGIIAHYCAGARWPTGEVFKSNVTLWWACPWTLSVAAVQAGGLGMVALGLTQLVASRIAARTITEAPSSIGLWLCVAGLIGVFLIGYPGYFVFDAIWPGFFYRPVMAGKNAWLVAQGLCIAVYLLGALTMFGRVRHVLNAVLRQEGTNLQGSHS
jgi:hypothetical protein